MHEDSLPPAGYRDDSYQLDRMPDREAELRRLVRQASVGRKLERGWLKDLEIAADARVLDLGCGPGITLELLSQLVPQGRLIGVDADPAMVELGRRRATRRGLDRVRLVHGSAEALPLEDDGMDLAHLRFVLQHMPRPMRVLEELRRVVRSGGRVVVVDTDDGNLLLHPEPEGLAELLAASHRAQARKGGDRHLGRRLRGHLRRAGLRDVTVRAVPVTSELLGMETFVEVCLGFKSRIIPDAELPTSRVKRILASARALAEDPDAFGVTMVFVAVGRVP